MTALARNIWTAQLDAEFTLPRCEESRGTDSTGATHHQTGSSPESISFLTDLESIIGERKQNLPEGAYTTSLFEKGVREIAKKVGEEGVEVALAALAETEDRFADECADLLYHFLVLLQEKDMRLANVVTVLKERNQ